MSPLYYSIKRLLYILGADRFCNIMEQLTDKSMEGFISKPMAGIVLFRADWCPFCRKFKPVFDSYEGRTKARMAEAVVNEDENPLWDRFNIQVIPTMIAFKDGKVTARTDGIAGRGLDEADMKGLISKIEA